MSIPWGQHLLTDYNQSNLADFERLLSQPISLCLSRIDIEPEANLITLVTEIEQGRTIARLTQNLTLETLDVTMERFGRYAEIATKSGSIEAFGYFARSSDGRTIKVLSNTCYPSLSISEIAQERQETKLRIIKNVYKDWNTLLEKLGDLPYRWVELKENQWTAVRMAAVIDKNDVYMLFLKAVPNPGGVPLVSKYIGYSDSKDVSLDAFISETGVKLGNINYFKRLEHQPSGPMFGGLVRTKDGKEYLLNEIKT
jgi:hypothetical protein